MREPTPRERNEQVARELAEGDRDSLQERLDRALALLSEAGTVIAFAESEQSGKLHRQDCVERGARWENLLQRVKSFLASERGRAG